MNQIDVLQYGLQKDYLDQIGKNIKLKKFKSIFEINIISNSK